MTLALHEKLGAAILAAALAAPAAAAEPIKIGLITIDSGPFAPYMKSVLDPARLAVDTINARGGAGGRPLELVVQSHPGTPAAALQAANRVVQKEGASFITGWFSSSIALALSPRVAALNVLMFDPVSNAADLTGKACQANYFRFSQNEQMIAAALRSIVQQSGIQSWNIVAADYAAGHGFAKQMQEFVAGLQGSVQRAVFVPLGTQDFGSVISQLGDKPADGLAVAVFGSDAIALAKQQQQYGLFAKYKRVVSWGFTDEITLPAQGDSTVGVHAIQSWSASLPGPRVAAFAKAFDGRFGRTPNYVEADVYASFEMLAAAIDKAKSADITAVRAALAGLKTDTVLGPVEMRAADHQLMRPVLGVQVVRGADQKPRVAVHSVQPADLVAPPVSAECRL